MYFQLTEARPAIVLLSPPSVGGTGVIMPARKHALIDKQTLTQLYFDEGLALRAIAAVTGTNYRLVRDSFKAHGLPWRSKSEARAGRSWDETTKAKIAVSRTGQKDAPEVVAFTRHPCRVPDVLIEYADGSAVLEEIKPLRVAQDARAKGNKLATKLTAGEAHARANGWGWRIFSYDGEGGAPSISS